MIESVYNPTNNVWEFCILNIHVNICYYQGFEWIFFKKKNTCSLFLSVSFFFLIICENSLYILDISSVSNISTADIFSSLSLPVYFLCCIIFTQRPFHFDEMQVITILFLLCFRLLHHKNCWVPLRLHRYPIML